MEKKGVSAYGLREKRGIDGKTVRRLNAKDDIESKALNELCAAPDFATEDITEYIPIRLRLPGQERNSIRR